ncbi:hypothetical protein JCM19236_4088 [Vibrio sp. JCM 19236]|nr:hypothetical protein JCM19236_4088 [Vibrio sp. JCM 19236]
MWLIAKNVNTEVNLFIDNHSFREVIPGAHFNKGIGLFSDLKDYLFAMHGEDWLKDVNADSINILGVKILWL